MIRRTPFVPFLRRASKRAFLALAMASALLLPTPAVAETPVEAELRAVVDRFLVRLG